MQDKEISFDEYIEFVELHLKSMQEENENLKIALANARNSHAILARGIKRALLLENWPDLGNELFAEAVVKLLVKEVDKLRYNCTN